MPERRLDVWCLGRRAGALRELRRGMAFAYDPEWRDAGMGPLSQSLPLDGAFGDDAVAAFFGGLLPEGAPRDVLARRLGISRDNDFSLLVALGGDTAGAVSLLAPDEEPSSAGGDEVRWLSEAALAEQIRDLPTRPLHADEDGEYRLSLAGAQDKLPVVVDADGRVGLTRGRTPSTHILKAPIAHLQDTVANEAMCLDVGRRLGIATAHAEPRRVGATQCLLVERYDRVGEGGTVRRLHQEDVCQALAIPPTRKYQAEGGPSLADCFALLRRAVTVPALDAIRLLDQVVLSYLVANHDAHGKNYSLIYTPGRVELAPAYDVLSTFVYRGALRLSRKLAMSIGGEYRPEYVRARHVDQLLEDAQLGRAAARRRIAGLAARAPAAADAARAALAEAGWDAPTLEQIVALVGQRAERLRQATA